MVLRDIFLYPPLSGNRIVPLDSYSGLVPSSIMSAGGAA